MTREEALEFLLRQALWSLNGFKPNKGVFIKAKGSDYKPFQVWRWAEKCEKTFTGEPWLPDGIKHDFIDCSEQISDQRLNQNEAIEMAVRELTRGE